jgi:hypothetical protein
LPGRDGDLTLQRTPIACRGWFRYVRYVIDRDGQCGFDHRGYWLGGNRRGFLERFSWRGFSRSGDFLHSRLFLEQLCVADLGCLQDFHLGLQRFFLDCADILLL